MSIADTPRTLEQISLNVIQPLCDETKRMFAPISLQESDRIKIKMHKDQKQFHAEFYSMDSEGREYSASYNAQVRFPFCMPARQRWSDRIWLFEATDLSCLLLSHHWKPYQLVFEDGPARAIYNYRLLNFIRQTNNVIARDNIDEFEYKDSANLPLAPYQKKALKASLYSEGFGLFMEQGTGKTAIAIARMCNEAVVKDGPYRVLIICPKSVRINWKEEIKRFASVPGSVTIVSGSKLNRFKCIVDATRMSNDSYCQFSVCIISMDSVDKTEEALTMTRNQWDLCILDESHGIKNPATKRWKAMQKIREVCKSRMVLTGTPITNTLFDLWTQFEFMGEGWSGFTSFKKFCKFYGNFQNVSPQSQNGYQKLVGLTNLPMIQERLARQAFLIKKSEALPDLPEKTYDIYEVEMSKEQEKCYRQLCDTLMAEFENMLAKSKDVLVVNNILTQMLRLAQVTSGFVGIPAIVDEDGVVIQEAKINRFDPSPKIEAAVEILKEKHPHEKTIIWTNWVQNIKTLKSRLDYEKIKAVTYYGGTSDKDRQAAVTAFNEDPETKVLIGNPRAGGVGLNLLGYKIGEPAKTFCNHVIYFAQNWSAVDRSQSEDRPHRRGTKCHVRYTDLVVPDTIDQEIRCRVLDKRMSALKIQDVKAVISRIMRG